MSQFMKGAMVAVFSTFLLVACGMSGSTKDAGTTPGGAKVSTVTAALGGVFTGNYVKITGQRNHNADGKYPCKNRAVECIALTADGKTVTPLDKLCPSEDTPTGTWRFDYELHAGEGCESLLANLKCEPHEAEYLDAGHNYNHVECYTRNADKSFDFCVVDPYTGAGRENCPDATKKVLFLDRTLVSGATSPEVQAAVELGFIPEIVDDNGWLAKSTSDFAGYRAVVFGDANCAVDFARLDAPLANRAIWSPAITGNMIIAGNDPTWHVLDNGLPGAYKLIKDGLGFATYRPYQTGAYVSLSCYRVAPATQLMFLEKFGQFAITNNDGSGPIAIVNTAPVLDDLTVADLSGWINSYHEIFDTTPGSPFCPFAVALAPGAPYIVARGLTNPCSP